MAQDVDWHTVGPRLLDALEDADKLVANFFAPWGAWKTAWWAGIGLDDDGFEAEPLLRLLQTRARSAIVAAKGETT